jgi:hypothetical protein
MALPISLSMLTVADVTLHRGLKRPDDSWTIRPNVVNNLPLPHPAWLRFLPNGKAYPNLVVEVAVNHEGPRKLKEDCHRYFHPSTSVCVWVGIKVWVTGRKFWVGWAERAPAGDRGIIHTTMRFPPHHTTIDVPCGIVYSIPMATIYGPGIPIPAGSLANLEINCDSIREVIVEWSGCR